MDTLSKISIIIFTFYVITFIPDQHSFAQDNKQQKDYLSFSKGNIEGKFKFAGGFQALGQLSSYWNLDDIYSPASNFVNDRNWFEGYLRAGLKLNWKKNEELMYYGGMDLVFSGTAKKDLFDAGNTGRVLPENAFIGATYSKNKLTFDLSAGMQDYHIGTGMLVYVGTGNGYERGAMVFAPRTAWKMTAIGKMKYYDFSLDGFFLDYNGLDAPNNNYDRLAGAKAEYSPGGNDDALSLAYLNSVNSTMPYPQAPITMIENGRDGLNVINTYIKYSPFKKSFPALNLRAEFTYEWKKSIDMNAYGGEISISNTFIKLPWNPTLRYAYRIFSGDDPGTITLERFDPLFYYGTPTNWASGGNASFTFYNSNINVHVVELTLTPSPKDIINILYWNIGANQLNSPLQFGQTARPGNDGSPVIVGVTSKGLSNDIYIGYTRLFNNYIFATLGWAISMPSEGIKQLAPDKVKSWNGAFCLIGWNF